jgi:hypothetical protein
MATYKNHHFKTPLLARWAAFFDLAGWKWHQNPAPVGDWVPDFYVEFGCDHSGCSGSHSLLVSVLPVSDTKDFGNHPCRQYDFGWNPQQPRINASAGAAFGAEPLATSFQFSHGDGGGLFNVPFWVPNYTALWEKAGQLVSS